MPEPMPRDDNIASRTKMRDEDIAWRAKLREDDIKWRTTIRDEDVLWRRRESRFATWRIAFAAAAQISAPGTSPEALRDLALRLEELLIEHKTTKLTEAARQLAEN